MSKDQNQQDEHRREGEALAEHRLRMRFQWNDLIEELIQEGQERGAFDDLCGQGKPLNLESSPYKTEWELAHQLMKENDVLPPWIVKRNEILLQIEQMRADYGRRWTKHERAFRLAQGEAHRDALALSWDDICRRWEADLKHLNKQIADFNLGRPSERLEMFKLIIEKELERIGATRTLKDVTE